MNYPLYLAGKPVMTGRVIEVFDKFRGDLAGRVAAANPEMIAQAIELARKAAPAMAELGVGERIAALRHCATRIAARKGEWVDTLCAEAGKPLRDARNEVARAIDTFEIAAEEAGRWGGEIVPMDRVDRGKSYRGMWRRFPVGPCALIVPFNFPLNLAAHKIAPAIAAGCPFVMKPASYTAISGSFLGELLAGAGLPEGAFSILPCHREDADLFATDPQIKLLSFTGSPAVGWELKQKAGRKKVVLELGGNAAVYIAEDAAWEEAIPRIVAGGFAQSGQSCISVQRLFVDASLYDRVKERLVSSIAALRVGDPRDEATVVGPLITEKEAVRLERWIDEALTAGAKRLVGGRREKSLLWPTLLEGVPSELPLLCEEAFGPVIIVDKVSGFDEAIEKMNATKFGLQAGVFTSDLNKMFRAWERLEVGGVMINEVPTFRLDQMPYGGIKESGLGREGLRFALEDMTEIRMLAVRVT